PMRRRQSLPYPVLIRNSSLFARADATNVVAAEDADAGQEAPKPGMIYVAVVDQGFGNPALDLRGNIAQPAGEEPRYPAVVSSAAILDTFPTHVRTRLATRSFRGCRGLGRIDRRQFGVAFGKNRKRVVAAHAEALRASMARNGLEFETMNLADLKSVESSTAGGLLAASAIVMSNDRAYDPTSPIDIARGAVVFHPTTLKDMRSYLAGGSEPPSLVSACPLFLTCKVKTFRTATKGKELPDYVKLVSVRELERLARSWLDSMQLDSNVVLPGQSEWRYFDTGGDPGDSWNESGFNDSEWKLGKGKFGYGGDGEDTTISFGDNSDKKYPSYFFRRQVEFEAPSPGDVLVIEYVVDDGCVIYVDGEEVTRYGMPAGSIIPQIRASSTASGAAEKQWHRFVLSQAPKNPKVTIAASVHQATSSSSDLGFDLKITRLRWSPR
ncbi:MAG: hypothetical protein AAF488_18635, partial [Planctomycetota bacterium]